MPFLQNYGIAVFFKVFFPFSSGNIFIFMPCKEKKD